MNNGKDNSDDEEEDDNEVFFCELQKAQRTLCNKFHIDSEVEIDISTFWVFYTAGYSTALKAEKVLITISTPESI